MVESPSRWGLWITYIALHEPRALSFLWLLLILLRLVAAFCLTWKLARLRTASPINHQLLTYLSKRLHYSTPTFRLRMNLALLDWVSMDAIKLNSCHGNVLCTTSPSSSQSALTGCFINGPAQIENNIE